MIKNFAFKKLGINRDKVDDSIFDELGFTNFYKGETKEIAIKGFKDITNYINSNQFIFLDDWGCLIPIIYNAYSYFFSKTKNNVDAEEFIWYIIESFKQNGLNFTKHINENVVTEFKYFI